MPVYFLRIALLLSAFALVTPAYGELASARVTSIFPPGGQAGSSFDVTVAGADLENCTLQFSHAGITAKRIGEARREDAKFAIAIAADVPVGVYDCRAAGQFGISNARAVVVTDRREANVKPGTTLETAGRLPLNATASAQASANTADHWTFEARSGQRLLIECQTRDIDSRLSPSMTLYDSSGSRELANSRRVGLIDFTVPGDGSYLLRVQDGFYRGGAECSYRLTISTGPRLEHVFPPAGVAGTKQAFALFGRNLPGGKTSQMRAPDGVLLDELKVEIELPKEAAPHQRLDTAGLLSPAGADLGGFAYRLKSEAGVSNAVPILFTSSLPVMEVETSPGDAGNNTPDLAQAITLPIVVAGRFYPRGDRDCFAFDARKGDVYFIEIISDRLGALTAPSIVIQKFGGGKFSDVLESPDEIRVLAVKPFRNATRDPMLKWEAKEDGRYCLIIRNTFGAASDNASAIYLLSVRKPSPAFEVLASAGLSSAIRQGGYASVRVTVLRRDGYSGDVTVRAEGLPPGVSAEPLVLHGDVSTGVLVFAATEVAKPVIASLRLVATGKVGDVEVARPVMLATVALGASADGVDPATGRVTRDMAVSVLGELEPLIITPAENKTFEALANGKLSIPLKLKRTTEQKQPMKLTIAGIDGVLDKVVTLDAKAETGTFNLNLSEGKFAPGTFMIAPGTYTICLSGSTQVKYTRPEITLPGTREEAAKDKSKKSEGPKDVQIVFYSAPFTIKILKPLK